MRLSDIRYQSKAALVLGWVGIRVTSNIFPWIMGAKGRCPRLGTSHNPVVQGLCSAGRSNGRHVAFEKGLVKPAVETLTPPADTPKPRTQTSHHPSGRRTPAVLLEGPERSLLGRSKDSLVPGRPAAGLPQWPSGPI